MSLPPDKAYEEWKEEYGLEATHSYTIRTDQDCYAAFMAGRRSLDEKISALNRALEDKNRRIVMASKALGFEP